MPTVYGTTLTTTRLTLGCTQQLHNFLDNPDMDRYSTPRIISLLFERLIIPPPTPSVRQASQCLCHSTPSMTTFQSSSVSTPVLPYVDHFVPPSDSTGAPYPYANTHSTLCYSCLPASPSEVSSLSFLQSNASLDDLEWFNVQPTDI
ncbi:hypothetical protein HYDPIDRAFT_27327 [Hydnomerulius pinastri MD-312]|nr:hypothetical protein HYDPIDRAFT_27327 [Hydnomerulius pinastri MD-312]